MATRTMTTTRRQNSLGARDVIVKWAGLLNGDDGAWFSEPGMVLRAYSVSGTFGVAGNVALKASCGNAIDPTAAIVGTQADESILSGAGAVIAAGTVTAGQYTAAPSYRPTVTAGDGTTNLTVTMYFIAD
jgi:hypothetical protein